MPTVNVFKDVLFKALGREYSTEQFEELCFEYGIELEDETSEQEMVKKEQGEEKAKGKSNRGIYRIDVPANRYDLLCAEGLSRALKVYVGNAKPPVYKLVQPAGGKVQKVTVLPETAQIRPHLVCAVLRGITFDQDTYDSFIELQDKLHNNICRKRTLVAIGTHDLDTLKGPFTYEALAPTNIKFVPLNQTKEMNAEELMTFYESDRKLSKFLHIIRDSPVYPVIYDSNRTVLSLPPIINSNHSKIALETKNVFIECTATDITKARVVLNTIVAMFSQYCAEPFTVEPVEIATPNSTSTHRTPDISSRTVEATVGYINKSIGIHITADEVVRYLAKMSLSATLSSSRKSVSVSVPITRSDILHACDVMEDVAIAYGFNKIAKTVPRSITVGAPFPLNKLADFVRRELALSGYTEVLPLILCSHDENYEWLRRKDNGEAVKLANPQTIEFQVVRTSLIQGVLKTISSNKAVALPIKVFEVSDVVFKDESRERKSRNQRNMCVVFASKTSAFETVHGILDRIMAMLNVKLVSPDAAQDGYFIRESDNPTYFPGRCAEVVHKALSIGHLGIVHPEVLQKFEVPFPCTALEINIEPFL
ncbi:hypothetical protein BJ742DRAFT_794551 [Cladochytrium replicatum]|nr:hypothetical protein BJ742DRAFT_794551 [Cladochytrium replicatum]